MAARIRIATPVAVSAHCNSPDSQSSSSCHQLSHSWPLGNTFNARSETPRRTLSRNHLDHMNNQNQSPNTLGTLADISNHPKPHQIEPLQHVNRDVLRTPPRTPRSRNSTDVHGLHLKTALAPKSGPVKLQSLGVRIDNRDKGHQVTRLDARHNRSPGHPNQRLNNTSALRMRLNPTLQSMTCQTGKRYGPNDGYGPNGKAVSISAPAIPRHGRNPQIASKKFFAQPIRAGAKSLGLAKLRGRDASRARGGFQGRIGPAVHSEPLPFPHKGRHTAAPRLHVNSAVTPSPIVRTLNVRRPRDMKMSIVKPSVDQPHAEKKSNIRATGTTNGVTLPSLS